MPTYLTYPDQFDAAYFEMAPSGLYHDAGYTYYPRENFKRADLGEFLEESQARLEPGAIQYTAVTYFDDLVSRMSGRFNLNTVYLELGCAYGYWGEAALAAGIDWWGLDNMFCYNRALVEAPNAAQRMLQAWTTKGQPSPYLDSHPDGVDALTFMQDQKNSSWPVVVSRRFLSLLDPTYLSSLVTEMNRVARDQIHIIMTDPNPLWYTVMTLEQWRDAYSWKQQTILVEDHNLEHYVVKV